MRRPVNQPTAVPPAHFDDGNARCPIPGRDEVSARIDYCSSASLRRARPASADAG
jgi:hypothetical protein